MARVNIYIHDNGILNLARQKAREMNTSLSELFAGFLLAFIKKSPGKGKISPLVKSLSGTLSNTPDNEARLKWILKKK